MFHLEDLAMMYELTYVSSSEPLELLRISHSTDIRTPDRFAAQHCGLSCYTTVGVLYILLPVQHDESVEYALLYSKYYSTDKKCRPEPRCI